MSSDIRVKEALLDAPFQGLIVRVREDKERVHVMIEDMLAKLGVIIGSNTFRNSTEVIGYRHLEASP